ncbi:MAG: UDP-N-acetylmuramate--L-alanine ligase, partial [Clostridia bacterium]|nr:UDP-N-acetylmuramate--L-alanine ligase [Clostridia bacterium]
KFSAHIGGKDLTFSNFYCCGYDYFITEACEYKKNFLRLKPDVAVILNSDADHLECYGSEEALKSAYVEFSESAKRTVALLGDLPQLSGISFGFEQSAEYYAKNIKTHKGICTFTAYERNEKLGNISLNVFGKHNVLNALAAIAVTRCFGISFEQIKAGLNSFIGVERRFEKFCETDGILYYADYAHHPNELRASLKTARSITKGKLFVVFQPRTCSLTKLLFGQYVRVL